MSEAVISETDMHTDADFTDNIFRRFRDGPVGDICRQNLLIQLVGYKHYVAQRCEISKINETRKEVSTSSSLTGHFTNIMMHARQ
jgi:hypothetical protein